MKPINYLILSLFWSFGLVGCGSGALPPPTPTPTPTPIPPTPPSSTSVGVSNPGTLFGINTAASSKSAASIQNLDNQATVYYLPIYNTSANSLNISKVEVTNPEGSNVWSSGKGTCNGPVPSNGSCLIAIGFNGRMVNNAQALNSVATITYANGLKLTIPLNGTIVESGSLAVELPKVIVPNSDGMAYGVITVFNGTDEAQSISASDIAPQEQEGVTWEFTPNCDGNGGTTVEPFKACSVAFTYQVDEENILADTPPKTISVAVPLVNTTTNQPTIIEPVSTSLPPTKLDDPKPHLVYSGGVVSLTSSSASFVLSNVGNGVLQGITISGLPNGITQMNDCANLPANGSCVVTLNKATGATVPPSITVTPNVGVAINISLAGQQLAVAPTTIDFGTNFGGATQQRTVTVTNMGATPLNGITFNLSNGAYQIGSNDCSSGNLAGFTSCKVIIDYEAPNQDSQQIESLTVSASDQEIVSVSLNATSKQTNWNNLMTDGNGYTAESAAIISLIAVQGQGLLFGNSMPPGVTGARQVWGYNNNTFTPQNLTGLSGSALTALAPSFVGTYAGSFYKCTSNNCSSVGLSNQESFGVTSIIQVDANIAFAGLSDKSTGTTGALWFYNNGTNPPTTPININGAAVGKMAISGNTLFIPTHALNQNGKVVLVSTTGNINNTFDVNAFVAGSGEYFTVLYTSGDTIYGGTNLGNVYRSSIANLSANSWTKLTQDRLSTSSIVTDISVVNNKLYVAIGRLNNPVLGGALFTYSNNKFTKVVGYADTSSISALATDANTLYVGTYAGNIWSVAVQ